MKDQMPVTTRKIAVRSASRFQMSNIHTQHMYKGTLTLYLQFIALALSSNKPATHLVDHRPNHLKHHFCTIFYKLLY